MNCTPIDTQVELMLKYGRMRYERNGDGVDTLDCVALVKLYFKDFRGVVLPESPWAWRHYFDIHRAPFEIIPNDVLLMMAANRLKLTDHMGVAVSDLDMIHACSAFNGLVCEPINKYKHLILGIARLK